MVDNALLAKVESISRNPLVMQTFHRIGLSERAGSGLRDIMRSWQQLDRPQPQIDNDKAPKTLRITLGKHPQVTALQVIFQQKAGAKLSDTQAKVFAACLSQPVTIAILATTLEIDAGDINHALDHLISQALVSAGPQGYQARQHFREPLAEWAIPAEVNKKETTNLTKLGPESDQAHQLSHFCSRSLHVTCLLNKSQKGAMTSSVNKFESPIRQRVDQSELTRTKANKKAKT